MVLKTKSGFQPGNLNPPSICIKGCILKLMYSLIIRSRSRSNNQEPSKKAKGYEEGMGSFERGRARSREKVQLSFQASSLDFGAKTSFELPCFHSCFHASLLECLIRLRPRLCGCDQVLWADRTFCPPWTGGVL